MDDASRWTVSQHTVEGPVYRITMCRPEVLNALSPALYGEVRAGILAGLGHPEVRVIVVQGCDGVFATGGDLKMFRDLLELPEAERMVAFNDRFDVPLPFQPMLDCWKPVIAKIDGYCLAGGTIMAAAADIAIATDRSVFGIPEGRVGLADPFAGTLLPAAIGLARARYMLLTAARVDAATAERWGLILRCVAPEALDDAVSEVIDQLVRVAPESQRGYKRSAVRALPRMNPLEIMEAALGANGLEGLSAFAEKRPPQWNPTRYPV
jgi:enoyl-CoA hydratase/carnithine racemase